MYIYIYTHNIRFYHYINGISVVARIPFGEWQPWMSESLDLKDFKEKRGPPK